MHCKAENSVNGLTRRDITSINEVIDLISIFPFPLPGNYN